MIELGQHLIEPMSEHLASGKIRNITVVPDGPLNGLPFALLRLSSEDGPLIERAAISYAHSFESRQALEQRINQASRFKDAAMLVVSDPVDAQNDVTTIARITQTQAEAQMILDLFGDSATSLAAASASKENILSALKNDYAILHFATHGLLNSDEPALSGLMFSKVSDQPNFWLAPEISNASLKANLVVLSACESAVGRGVSGEGMMSLSRAFLEGGASHVLGTLWKVEDFATAQLAGQFYSYLLNDSLAISVALQRAQLATYQNRQNDWRDPYYWAGFQLQGGWNTLVYANIKQNTE